MLGGLGALVVLAFVFASLLAFVPLLMAIVSIMATFLVLWGVTALTSVSMIVEFLVALIGLGVAIDYSLLVVVRWREERAHGHTATRRVVRAMETAGRAVVFSGTTVAIGLLAMVVLPLPFLRSIGYAGMLIPLVSVIVATTLLPIVLVKAGNRLDWPHMRCDDRRQPLVDAVGAAGRPPALVRRRRRPRSCWPRSCSPPPACEPGQANVDTLSQQGDAPLGLAQLERSGIGSGALAPMEILAPAGAARQRGGDAGARARRARRGGPDRRPVAARRHRGGRRARRGRPLDLGGPRHAHPRQTAAHASATASASAAPAPRTRTSSTRSTGASR